MKSGSFVISLDFELRWGVRDKHDAWSVQRPAWLGARRAIPRMLDLFEKYGIEATWATVGFLFAESRDELEAYYPKLLPSYRNPELSPYSEQIGKDEKDDPVHFAASLIEKIRQAPGQEIATHTFSHYYCLEPGQTIEQFEADLASAVAIARSRGIELRSIVFPRNQWRPEYLRAVRTQGLECFRGTERSWMHTAANTRQKNRFWKRAARLADTYVNLSGTNVADCEAVDGDLYNIPASCYLRPWSPALAALERVRLERMLAAMRDAAAFNRIYHIYWHPQDFGVHLEENLAVLERLLEEYRRLKDSHGFQSLGMDGVVDLIEERTAHQSRASRLRLLGAESLSLFACVADEILLSASAAAETWAIFRF